ncbi:efflux RND transporter permease subunit [Campylobacter sputorum]|uniref:efflux RND transporter permease subunit n=1 Tax=Campylobacter sputorum TaxID=206 RepID=UPI000B76C318|nr:multidrug efflux RND transporter permease subunit [Campylobacter sputorum]ASM36123.1 multidrug efflux system CmeABC, inner membrane drug transporter CmeB [Campylobacter sputorum bv. faecalis CCUG 20703]
MFSKFFIHRPVFACVISIVIVIAGIISLKVLPVEEYPQLTPPQIVVHAVYPGADAQTIADTVAAPLEDAINGVENMIYMQSTSSSSGVMTLSVYFKIGTDPQEATVNVNNRVRSAEAQLPQEVKRNGITAFERSTSILSVVTVFDPNKDMDIVEINNYATINIAETLKRVPGVGEAVVIGEKDYSIRIWLKPDLMQKYAITTTDIINSIREQNSQFAAGKLGEAPLSTNNPYVLSIKPEGRLKSIKEFENIIIRSDNDGSMLRLKDLADIEFGAQNYTFEGKMNGVPTAPILIFLQNDANALATSQAIKAELERLSKSFPGTLTYNIPYDTTDFIQVSINEVVKTFIEALILVIIVMYFFLGNLRATLIPMLAVPVSIIGAFGGIYLMGFSINMITLFALILAIGIVVDDAIIVIENVERILEEEPELSVVEATEKAMGQMFAPVVSIVLVLSAVFVPVAFMEGFVGIIQKQFALTLVVSVCISGLVALTLTPALCATILTKKREEKFWIVKKFNDFFDFSTNIFTAGVAKILRHIIPSLIFIAIMLFSIYHLMKVVPGGLVPMEDKGAVIAVTTLPPASTLARTSQNIDNISKVLSQDENIKYISAMMGYDLFSGSLRENAAVMFINFIDWSKRTTPESSSFYLADKYNKMLYSDRDSMTFVMNPPPIMGLSVTGGFEMYAQSNTGKGYNEIEADMQKLAQAANQRPELKMVRTTLDTNFPQYELTLDRDKVKMLGIDIQDLFLTINANIGTYYVNDFNLMGKTFKVNLRAKSEFRNNPDDFRMLYVRNSDGDMIPLDNVVSLKRVLGPDNVDRFNGFRAAKIMGEPNTGYTSGQAIKAINEVFNDMFDNEYTIGWSGSAYQEVQSSGTGTVAFIFGLIFVYLILAAQYERWLMPAAVITAVPFSVFGALLFSYFGGQNNDVYFQIGLLLLIGLAAKNAILIVEFAMEEHRNGKSIFEASINASKIRFRPIVMTSLAFTLGVLPMVLSSGAGSASRHALGTGVVGGMIAASTIAIFFIPMFFYIFESFNSWLDGKFGKNDSDDTNKNSSNLLNDEKVLLENKGSSNV